MNKFHNEKNQIVTALEPIRKEDLKEYFENNLTHFPKGTVFRLFTGHHHQKLEDDRVSTGKSDSKLVAAYNDLIDSFENECAKNCKECDECKFFHAWKLGEYKFDLVKSLSTYKKGGKYKLRPSAKIGLRVQFEDISRSDVPNVIIFASCYSYFSEIKTIMMSCGLISAVAMASDRGDITGGKYFVCDPEQRTFLKAVSECSITGHTQDQGSSSGNSHPLRVIVLAGHYGTGKTLLASEAVKMILARLKETSKDVDVNVLTFGGGYTSYELLMKDLKNKWFADQDVNIQHFTDFLKRFTEEHKKHLNPKQLEDLQDPKERGAYRPGGDHFKDVLITICEMMKKLNKTSIIMMDEVSLYLACRKTTENGKTSYHVDFSYLAKYDNIHFVICMRPMGEKVKDFNLIFPTNEEGQLYQLLKKRHRNNIEILRFLIFYQKNLPQEMPNGFPSIDLEEILDEASLPPVLDPPGCGVIWIPSGVGSQEEEKALDKVKEIMATLQGEPSVSILYALDDSKRLAENLLKANNQASWNGPYETSNFNGAESNVIIYFSDAFLDIEDMARPRQLLILVTCGEDWNDPSEYANTVKPMNEAVKQNLVRKIGDTKFTKMSLPSAVQNEPSIQNPIRNSPNIVTSTNARRNHKKCCIA